MLLTILTLALLKHAGPLGFRVEVSVALRNTRTSTQLSAQILSNIEGYAQVFNYLTICVFIQTTEQSLAYYKCPCRCIAGRESSCGKTGPMFRSYCMSFTIFFFFIRHLYTSAYKIPFNRHTCSIRFRQCNVLPSGSRFPAKDAKYNQSIHA